MEIKNYWPGYENAQAEIYNTEARSLPAYKPATSAEIAKRYRSVDPDPTSKFYVLDGDRVVGYAAFNPNGRVSYPWCLPEAEKAREPLFKAMLNALRQRGCKEAWAAYRGDWHAVLHFLERQGFSRVRQIVNYVAPLSRLPQGPVPKGQVIASLDRGDMEQLLALGKGVIQLDDADALGSFYLTNRYFDPSAGYTLKRKSTGQTLGVALAIANADYADPTKLDAAMPCFRLGALGTETERHKRLNGMFSCVFKSEKAGEALLAEAARRFEAAGLTHAAAQAPSDQPALCAFYDRYFDRQGTFPILAMRLTFV